MMQRQVEHIVRLVDDLLDLSRIMQGKIQLRQEPVEVNAAVQNTLDECRHEFDAQQQQLSVSLPDAPVWVQADPVRLSQIVANLLSNANKYTEAGGKISLSVATDEQQVVIKVADTGIGIPTDMLGQIFTPFTQVSQSLDRRAAAWASAWRWCESCRVARRHRHGAAQESVRAANSKCGCPAVASRNLRRSLPRNHRRSPRNGSSSLTTITMLPIAGPVIVEAVEARSAGGPRRPVRDRKGRRLPPRSRFVGYWITRSRWIRNRAADSRSRSRSRRGTGRADGVWPGKRPAQIDGSWLRRASGEAGIGRGSAASFSPYKIASDVRPSGLVVARSKPKTCLARKTLRSFRKAPRHNRQRLFPTMWGKNAGVSFLQCRESG